MPININPIGLNWKIPACSIGIDTEPVHNINGETVATVNVARSKPHAQQAFIDQISQFLPSWGYSVRVEGDLLTITHDASGAYLRVLLGDMKRYVDHTPYLPFDACVLSFGSGGYVSIDDILKHLRPAPSEVKPLAVPTDNKAVHQLIANALCPLGYTVGVGIYSGGLSPYHHSIVATHPEWLRPFNYFDFTYKNGVVSSVKADGVNLKHPAVHTLERIEGAIAADELVAKLTNALTLTHVQQFWLLCFDAVKGNASRYQYSVELIHGVNSITIIFERGNEAWNFVWFGDSDTVRFVGCDAASESTKLFDDLAHAPILKFDAFVKFSRDIGLIRRRMAVTPPAIPASTPNEVERFWIVCGDLHNLNASYRHTKEEPAIKETARLQAKHGGQFLVFECIGGSNGNGPITVVDRLPF